MLSNQNCVWVPRILINLALRRLVSDSIFLQHRFHFRRNASNSLVHILLLRIHEWVSVCVCVWERERERVRIWEWVNVSENQYVMSEWVSHPNSVWGRCWSQWNITNLSLYIVKLPVTVNNIKHLILQKNALMARGMSPVTKKKLAI